MQWLEYFHRLSSALYMLGRKGLEFNLLFGSFIRRSVTQHCNSFRRYHLLLGIPTRHQTRRKIHGAAKEGVYEAIIITDQTTERSPGGNADGTANPKFLEFIPQHHSGLNAAQCIVFMCQRWQAKGGIDYDPF